jgi:cytochrome P450
MEIFAPLSASMLADPYSVYRRLREEDPVHWHEQLNAWIVTRHSDTLRILGDTKTFINDYRKIGEKAPEDILGLQTLDAPDHTEVRHILIEAMRRIDTGQWAKECGTIADGILSGLDLGSFDFVKEFNEPLALASMCAFFGVSDFGDEAKFHAAQTALVLSMDFGLEPSRLQPGIEARRYCTSTLVPWADHPPETGLMSLLDFSLPAELRNYLLNSLRMMFVAGFLSSSSNLSCVTRTLIEGGYLDRDEPLKVTQAVYNELVRHSGAVQVDTRGCAETMTLGGRQIRKGDEVLVVPAAANRDPAVFTDPDEVDFSRDPNPHVGFGRGTHSCIGAHLALGMHTTLLTQLSERYRLSLAGPVVQRPTGTLRGLSRMVLTARER